MYVCVCLCVCDCESQGADIATPTMTSSTVNSIGELPGDSNSLQLNVWSGSFKNSPTVSARRMWTGGCSWGGVGELQTWISLHSNGKVSLFVDR